MCIAIFTMTEITTPFALKFENTLGNRSWVKDNESKLQAIFPETWTHIQNLNPLQIGYQLKVVGIDWHSEEEFLRW